MNKAQAIIIPRARLFWWVAIWLIPIGIAGAIMPSLSTAMLTAAVLLMLIPVYDAIFAGRRLDGITVELDQMVRMTKAIEAGLDVHIVNQSKTAMTIRLAVAMPRELACMEDDRTVSLPAGAGRAKFSFLCKPCKRGSFFVRRCFIGRESMLGFWLKRKTIATSGEVRVYPNLLNDRKRMAGLFLNFGNFGIHAQRQIGQGREFEKLRDYIPGDSYGEIHWKATAKRGKPATKVYQIERTQEVYVIIDSSRLGGRIPEGPCAQVSNLWPHDDPYASNCLERYVTAGLILGMVAERQGDLFGVMSFSDRVDNFVRAKNGKAHYRACRESLYALQPRLVSPDFGELFSFIRTRMRRRALLVFLTSLDDPILSESFAQNVGLIARQHLVLVNMIQPAGVEPLFSRDNASTNEDIYRNLAGHMQWQRLRSLEEQLKTRGVQFGLMTSESFCPQLVSQYITVKRRQLI